MNLIIEFEATGCIDIYDGLCRVRIIPPRNGNSCISLTFYSSIEVIKRVDTAYRVLSEDSAKEYFAGHKRLTPPQLLGRLKAIGIDQLK